MIGIEQAFFYFPAWIKTGPFQMEDVTQISQMAQILNPKHSRTGTMGNMTMNAVDFEMLKQREIIPRTQA